MHADEVVSVHHRVNKSIENNGEVYIPIKIHVGVEPVEKENGGVVVHMKERKLPPLLSEHNENGVPEIPNLGNVKQPEKVRERRVLSVDINAGKASVSIPVSEEEPLDCHVGAEHDL